MHSGLYVGRVRHRRFKPVDHAFRYGIYMTLLDLAELDTVFAGRWFWSARRVAPVRFRREDHFGDPGVPLDETVRNLVAEQSGRRPAGAIRLLTNLRHFGYVMNPLSVFFCYDASGEAIEALVLEVHNTPWGERHAYVLGAPGHVVGGSMVHHFDKTFHVSPFMPMAMRYRCVVTAPGARLTLHLENWREGEKVFDATLSLKRKAISGPALAGALAHYPLMTVKVVAAIYFEALRLWWKGAPYYPHEKISEQANTEKPGHDGYLASPCPDQEAS